MLITKKDILIFVKGLKHGLADSSLTAEPKSSINLTKQRTKMYLSLYYNGSNCYLFVNGIKTYQFKAIGSELVAHAVCVGNTYSGYS